jgi:hypothetical protein
MEWPSEAIPSITAGATVPHSVVVQPHGLASEHPFLSHQFHRFAQNYWRSLAALRPEGVL